MNRARCLTAVVTLSALWLLGALVYLPRMENALTEAAWDAVEKLPSFNGRAARLEIAFDGQQALLRGKVRAEQDREAIAQAVRGQARAATALLPGLGLRFNPVRAVRDEIEVAPLPPGWLLLAAHGAQARLMGVTASEHEARDLARSLQETWETRGGTVGGAPAMDDERHDEAAEVAATLRGAPLPQTGPAVHIAPIGQAWRKLPLEKTDAALREEARALGVAEPDWEKQVRPALREAREMLQKLGREEAERRRLAALPPGHLFIASREGHTLLLGEVADESTRQALLSEALQAFADQRVHESIRVSADRRPGGDFPPLTTALLHAEQDDARKTALHLGIDGQAWTPVDAVAPPDSQAWKDSLPAGLKAGLLAADSLAALDWLQGGTPQAAGRPQKPAFVLLALFDDKAVLCGRVGQESERAQIIAATRRAAPPGTLVFHDDLLLDARCHPFKGLPHAIRSLPPSPARDSAGLLALTADDGSWTVLPVTPDLVETGGLARVKTLPEEIPASQLEEQAAEAIERLRYWISHLKPPLSTP